MEAVKDGNMEQQEEVQDAQAELRANRASRMRKLSALPAALSMALGAHFSQVCVEEGLLNRATLYRLLGEHQGRNPDPSQKDIAAYFEDVAQAIEAGTELLTRAQEIAQLMRTLGDMAARRGTIVEDVRAGAAIALADATSEGFISRAAVDQLFDNVTDKSVEGFTALQYHIADIVEGKTEAPEVAEEECDCDRTPARRAGLATRLREIVTALKKLPYNDCSPEADALVAEATDLEYEAIHIGFTTDAETNALADAAQDADRDSGNAAQGYYTFLEQLASLIEGAVLVSTLTEQVA